MKVLICEDEEVLLSAIELRLRKQGFMVSLAANGKQAIEKIKLEGPDLVIADLDMPDLSGPELIGAIRKCPPKSLPVIVIGALNQDERVMEALRAGASDFVIKPFKPAELVLRIRKVLQQSGAHPH